MQDLATINTFILSEQREEEQDEKIWYTWELHNSAGKSVSSRVWRIINNIRDERGRRFSFEQTCQWINQNVGTSDFRK